MIENKGAIAFWGLGCETQILLNKVDISSVNQAYIIDKDHYKQRIHYMGKYIHGPDILQNQDIKIVIPTPILSVGLHYKESIEHEVSRLNNNIEIVPFGKLINQYDEETESQYSLRSGTVRMGGVRNAGDEEDKHTGLKSILRADSN